LRDLVDDLSEEKAAEVLEWLEAEVNQESWPISDEERAAVERGLADSRAGRLVPLEEVEEELGLR
jgi:predicted transcriptional regulator